MSDKTTLEKFILNNKELEQLENLLAQFNIFETLNIVSAEIRHSSVLSWLLNPNANHGCGDYFVKLFLKYIFSHNREYLKSKISIFDLEGFDYSDLEIRREWNNIDVLIISPKNKFVVVIENKIGSTEHSNQLQRYHTIIDRNFPEYEKVFVYLTPEGESGSDEDWLVFDYTTILQIIEDVIEAKHSSIHENIVSFLRQYCIILRRYVVSNSEIEQICRDIYKKHQTALDLIFEYKPDVSYEIYEYLMKLIKDHDRLVPDQCSKSNIRFTTKRIDKVVPAIGEGWTRTKKLLVFEFNNYDSRLGLRLVIGPGPEEPRNQLYEIMKKNNDLFNRAKVAYGKKFNSVYVSEYLKKKDTEDNDLEVLKQKITKKFDHFVEKDLVEMESYIEKKFK